MPRLFIIAALAIAGLVTVDARPSRQTPFRAAGDSVPVYVTVTDKDDRLVTDLGRDRFQISDNGKVQPITLFDASPQPIRLVVLLDVSGSMSGNLGLHRAACSALFARLRPDDLAEQAMGDIAHVLRARPGGYDGEVRLDRAGVGIDDYAAGGLGQRNGERALAAGGRPGNKRDARAGFAR